MGKAKTQRFELKLGESGTRTTPSSPKKTKKIQSDPWYYLGFVGNLGISLVLPIAGGAFLGTILDSRWGSHPRATLALLLVGFVISAINLYMTVRRIIERETRREN